MIKPVMDFGDQVNALTGEIDRIDREMLRYRAAISAVDKEMKETAELAQDLSGALLASFVEFKAEQEALPERERRIEPLYEKVDARFKSVRDGILASYKGVIKERDAMMIEGEMVDLTPQSREDLGRKFGDYLDTSLVKYRQEAELNNLSNSSLQRRLQELEERKAIRDEASFALFDERTELSQEMFDVQDALRPQREALERLKGNLHHELNFYTAAQLGITQFLERKITEYRADHGGPGTSAKEFVNRVDERGFRALDYAVFANHLLTVSFLLDNEADPKLVSRSADSEGSEKGYTAIHWAAQQGCSRKMIERLSAAGANLNEKGLFERTPLHFAIFNHRLETTQFLLDAGADPNVLGEQFQVPPHFWAIEKGDVEMVELLMRCDRVDPKAKDLITLAVETGIVPIAKAMIEHPNFAFGAGEESPTSIVKLIQLAAKRNRGEMEAYLRTLV